MILFKFGQFRSVQNFSFTGVHSVFIEFYFTVIAIQISLFAYSDTIAIQNGIGDKLAIFIQWFSTFVAGITLGFTYGWQLTLVVISVSPLIILAAAIAAFVSTTKFYNT